MRRFMHVYIQQYDKKINWKLSNAVYNCTVLYYILVYSNYPGLLPLSNMPGWSGSKFGWSLEPGKQGPKMYLVVDYKVPGYKVRPCNLPAGTFERP